MRIGLRGLLRNQRLVKSPCAMRRLRIPRPLLVHIRAGICQHAVIPLRVVPRHLQRARAARTVARRRAPVRIVRQLHVRVALHRRQHLVLDKLGILARHRVVLKAALAALRVAAAVLDRDRHNGRQLVLGDQSIQRREQQAVRAIRAHNKGRLGSRHIALGNIHGDLAHIRLQDASRFRAAARGSRDQASGGSRDCAQCPGNTCCPRNSS